MVNRNQLLNMEGRIAIVTGAGRGIGRGISEVLARAGAHIVLAELEPETADETKRIVERLGGIASSVRVDVTDEASVEEMLDAAIHDFTKVDILVNNVGGFIETPKKTAVHEMTLWYWNKMLELNLTSQFLCCKTLIKYWLDNERPGNIVNIASLGGLVPYKTSAAYGAAKAGVISLTSTLANEYGKNQIRVNCIAPGHVTTPITKNLYRGKQELRKAQDKIIPLGRYGMPEDLGKAVLFMASDLSNYITGQTLLVSGGMYYFLTELP